MTPTKLNVLRAQMAASMYGNTTATLDINVAIHRADEILRSIGITADEPAPAEPAKPEPDYRELLRNLVDALREESSPPHVCRAWLIADKAVRQ